MSFIHFSWCTTESKNSTKHAKSVIIASDHPHHANNPLAKYVISCWHNSYKSRKSSRFTLTHSPEHPSYKMSYHHHSHFTKAHIIHVHHITRHYIVGEAEIRTVSVCVCPSCWSMRQRTMRQCRDQKQITFLRHQTNCTRTSSLHEPISNTQTFCEAPKRKPYTLQFLCMCMRNHMILLEISPLHLPL